MRDTQPPADLAATDPLLLTQQRTSTSCEGKLLRLLPFVPLKPAKCSLAISECRWPGRVIADVAHSTQHVCLRSIEMGPFLLVQSRKAFTDDWPWLPTSRNDRSILFCHTPCWLLVSRYGWRCHAWQQAYHSSYPSPRREKVTMEAPTPTTSLTHFTTL